MVEAFLKERVDVNARFNNNEKTQTVLHRACCNGHMEIVMKLVENKADINSISSVSLSGTRHRCYVIN